MNLQSGSLSTREQDIEIQAHGLDFIEKECWNLLNEGATKGKSAFHTFVLGTQGQYNIEMRTLVLRKLDKNSHSLFTHTDSRSPKVLQLSENGNCSLLFYDSIRRIQLRLEARALLHRENGISERIWNQTNLSARKSYLSMRPPGVRLSKPEDGLPVHLNGKDPHPEESENGKSNFLVLEFQIKSIDWLFLNAQGHRRARFEYSESGFEATWLNP